MHHLYHVGCCRGEKRLNDSTVDAGKSNGKKAKKTPDPIPGPVYDPATMKKGACPEPCMKIVSWNVAGLRAFLKKVCGEEMYVYMYVCIRKEYNRLLEGNLTINGTMDAGTE